MTDGRLFICGLMALVAGSSMTSCVDDSYDMSKDIDMTVGLGAKGLQLKVGNSEKIMLSDVLEVDKEEMLEETASGEFYLVKHNDANFHFDVNPFSATVDAASLVPSTPLLTFNDLKGDAPVSEVPIEAGWTTEALPITVASNDLFSITNIPQDMKHLNRIIPTKDSRKVAVYLEMVSNTTTQKFVIDRYENLKVELPSFFKLQGQENSTLNLGTKTNINSKQLKIAEFTIDAFDFGAGLDITEKSTIHIEEEYAMEGDFFVKASEDFSFKSGDEVTICVTVKVGEEQAADKVKISFEEVEGIFDPEINPEIPNISIGADIPEFLQDEEVCVMAANPTLRLDADLHEILANITLWGNLYAEKNGKDIASVRIPGNSTAKLSAHQNSVLYFCQEATPFDPTGVVEGASIYKVDNFNDIIKKIPDEIRIDMGNHKIQLTDEVTRITMGKSYNAALHYDVFIPFKFNSGLKIVYTEEIENIGEDLQDFSAEGVKILTTIDNAIPLDLELTADVLDASGNVIKGATVSTVTVPASKESNVELLIKFANPSDLKKLDQLNLKVGAVASTNGVTLTSDQYLQLKDLTIELLGQIVADFN